MAPFSGSLRGHNLTTQRSGPRAPEGRRHMWTGSPVGQSAVVGRGRQKQGYSTESFCPEQGGEPSSQPPPLPGLVCARAAQEPAPPSQRR